MFKFGQRQVASLSFKTQVLNPDFSVARHRPWERNLILDSWLNGQSTRAWLDNIANAAVGTATNPTKRDSGTITFTQSGNAVAASAGFFQSSDVGRLLKRDTGEEAYIVSYTDAQNVVVGGSAATLSASEGTVWYVNDIGLGNEVGRISTYTINSAENVTTLVGNTLVHQRTFISSPFGSPYLLREIGWSHSSSAGNNINGRAVIPGGGDSVAAGQMYKITLQLSVSLSPSSPLSVSDAGGGGFNTAGNFCVEAATTNTVLLVQPNGFANGSRGLETSATMGVRAIDANFTLQSLAMTDPGIPSGTVYNSLGSGLGYTNGNFYQDIAFSLPPNGGDVTIYGLTFSSWGGFVANRGATLKFTTPQTWVNGHRLDIVFRKSWGRILVN